jgi:membrane-associated phospholipid phosphatase
VAIGIADQTSISLLKPLVGRIRPCNALLPDQVRLLVRCSKAFSFPSAHAANSFAMATVIAWRFPRIAALGFAVAFVVAYSRVYVGVHYPLDAIGGAVVGLVAGRLAVWIVVRISSALRARRPLSAS